MEENNIELKKENNLLYYWSGAMVVLAWTIIVVLTGQWIEAVKFFQFLSLLYLIVLALQRFVFVRTVIVFLLFFIYYVASFFPILLQSQPQIIFIARYFKAFGSLSTGYLLAGLATLVMSVVSVLAINLLLQLKFKKVNFYLFILLFAVSFFFVTDNFVYLSRNFYAFFTDPVLNGYNKQVYEPLVNQLDEKKLQKIEGFDIKKRPAYLDNIIILQLESANGLLVNEENTPNILRLAKDGAYFSRFYANHVESVLGKRTVLCAFPPAVGKSLMSDNLPENTLCLPNYLKTKNYKSFYFDVYKVEMEGTDKILKAAGVDEMHNSDIMKPGDKKFLWGYEEQVFFDRTFDYLSDNRLAKHNFLFVKIGAQSHWPFADFKPDPKNLSGDELFRQRMIDSLKLQDKNLGVFVKKLKKLFPEGNYLLAVVGDHGWPVGYNPGNTFLLSGSYEENFRSILALVPGQKTSWAGKVVTEAFSQMDIMPSIIEWQGDQMPKSQFYQSFVSSLSGNVDSSHKIITLQPYDGTYINFIEDDDKLTYRVFPREFRKYKIVNEPGVYERQETDNIINITNINSFIKNN